LSINEDFHFGSKDMPIFAREGIGSNVSRVENQKAVSRLSP
jgi:hypothetical protein